MQDKLTIGFTKHTAKLTISQINIIADDELSIGNEWYDTNTAALYSCLFTNSVFFGPLVLLLMLFDTFFCSALIMVKDSSSEF